MKKFRNYNIKTALNKVDFEKLCEIRGKKREFRVNKGLHYMQVYVNKEELEKIRGGISPIKRLFFDIETSPILCYTWRIGSKINLNYENIVKTWSIICICWKFEGEEEIYSLTWDENMNDAAMLREFMKVASSADEIIGHNGDKFDIKKIRTRCLLHNIPAFPKYRSFDTLKKARGNFAFDSNRLDAIARYLGIGAKVEHDGFDMWKEVMEDNRAALNKMVEYCRGDVILVEDIYHALKHYVKPNTHAGVHKGGYKYTCPICAHEKINLVKNDVTQKGTISRVVECLSCQHVYNISNKSYMDYLTHKLNGSN